MRIFRPAVWRVFTSRLRKHAMLHLIIPVGVGILVENAIEALILKHSYTFATWRGLFWAQFLSFRTLSLASGVFLSFLVIMYFLVSREITIVDNIEDLETLQDSLDEAKSFFGISVIPLTEWFDPSMQVYLAKLLNRKLMSREFRHERTLLFFSRREYENARIQLMDEYYHGRCLAQMHDDCEIPLSSLRRDEIFSILDRLGAKEKEALCYPAWTKWRPLRIFRLIPLRLWRRRIPKLDFALVEKENNEVSVLRVSKRGEEIHIGEELKGDDEVKPYLELVNLIREKVYRTGTNHLRPSHNFVRIYYRRPRVRTRLDPKKEVLPSVNPG